MELDLDKWSRALKDASLDAAAARDRILAQAGMRSMPRAAGSVSIEIAEARLGRVGVGYMIVQARYADPDGTESLRVAILRPVQGLENVYCALGDDLSYDKQPGEEPCSTQHEGPVRLLSLTQVIAADRDTLVVHDAGGWCGGGDRGDKLSIGFWGVEDGLVRYFEGVTYEAWYRSPFPPTRVVTGTVEWTGSWPKTLVYTRTVTCEAKMEGSSVDCVPGEQTIKYHYREGRYVRAGGDL
jgi:hypothetical protein